MKVKLKIRDQDGAYSTNLIHGVRASSTSSAAAAAERFGAKYFGPAFVAARPLQPEAASGQWALWEAEADPKYYAWCWATGKIETGAVLPVDDADGGGAVTFASGPQRALEAALGTLARHGYKEGVLLAPGVPEAEDQNAGMDALLKWVDWCAQGNRSANRHQVVFSHDRTKL